MNHPTKRAAYSLLELLVVLVILIAVTMMVIPMVMTQVETGNGQTQTPHEISTHATMNVIREAMIGEKGVLENVGHEPDAIPRHVTELVEESAPERVQQANPELSKYNPIYNIGWRGPYVLPTGTNEEGKPTLVDSWGNEIQIQADFDGDGKVNRQESRFIRIVSAGPNGEIETPADMSNMVPGNENEPSTLTKADCGDDLVVFLSVPDLRE